MVKNLEEKLSSKSKALVEVQYEIVDLVAQKEGALKANGGLQILHGLQKGKIGIFGVGFSEGLEDTRKRIIKCYPNLNLNFLYNEDQPKGDEP